MDRTTGDEGDGRAILLHGGTIPNLEALLLSDSTLLTIDQLATRLNVSRAQAYLVVRQTGFPLIELGPRLLRVDPRQLDAWLVAKAS